MNLETGFRLHFKMMFVLEGLDDDDLLEDIAADNGLLLVECPPLGVLDGKISIKRDFPEGVDILLGSTNNFEHFKLHHDGNNLKLPKCNFITIFFSNPIKKYVHFEISRELWK